MKNFESKITALVRMTTFESYGSSSDSDSNRSGSALSLCSAIEDSHLIAASVYFSKIIQFGQREKKIVQEIKTAKLVSLLQAVFLSASKKRTKHYIVT